MRMWFTGCVTCGARTTSVSGVCDDCDTLRSAGRAAASAGRRVVARERKRSYRIDDDR